MGSFDNDGFTRDDPKPKGAPDPPYNGNALQQQQVELKPINIIPKQSYGESIDVAGGHQTEGVVYINRGEEDQSAIYGFTRSPVKTAVTWLFIFLSGGLLRLVFHWQPKWMLRATHARCDLRAATRILVVEHYKKYKRYFVKAVTTLKADQIRLEPEFSVLSGGLINTGTDSTATAPTATGGSDSAPSDVHGETLKTLPIPDINGEVKERTEVRLFRWKKTSYIWDEAADTFYKLPNLSQGQSTAQLHTNTGLSWQQQATRRVIYGSNTIHVPVLPIPRLIFQEALNPFYIFQVFSVILWFSDDYVYYASVIVVTSVVSLASEVYQMHRNQVALSDTIQSSDVVEVLREGGQQQHIPSDQLVPGDLLLVPAQGCMMQCDAVLLQGNVIVNESMLTGESVPVTKTPVMAKADTVYTDKDHAKHTLYCGTKVIQTRFYGGEHVRAMVVRTGFCTNKGALVRSIMYPPPVDFKFQQDSYKFILVLVVIASFGFVYTVITKFLRDVPLSVIALDSLDLITIVIPPALPMAMTVGILYALRRLKQQKIYCISPRTVNISGVLNCICFDKTGTLTEDGLDLKGVVPVVGRVDIRASVRKNSNKHQQQQQQHSSAGGGGIVSVVSAGESSLKSDSESNNSPSSAPTECPKIYLGALDDQPGQLKQDHLLYAMASCHSITIINMEMVGDPLELKMFESTGWVLDEPGIDDTRKYDMMMPTSVHPPIAADAAGADNQEDLDSVRLRRGILRQFPFESSLQRMTVITRRLGDNHWDLYCKGSPEKIASLSVPDSVPGNFNRELRAYTDQGYRVLALAHKPITMAYHKIQRVEREEVECNLQFLGLLVMENKLKTESKPVIQQLQRANVRTIMVTGDNLLTALSVGRECRLVSPEDEVVEVTTDPLSGGEVVYQPTTPPQEPSFKDPVEGGGHVEIGIDEEEVGGGKPCRAPGRKLVAIDGKHWAALQDPRHKDLLDKLLVRGVVFARMNPDQKQQLITHLQGIGYYVGMCGDGANDCGALKAAHAGISLSEAEASVASPFTSKDPNISCVPTLIREGRTALVTSFGVFKYMAAYSLTQFVSIMILYSIDSNLTDFQFLYIDLFLITVFAVFFGRTDSYKGNLHPVSPPASLMSLTPILSILLHMALVISVQTICFFYVQEQSWFVPFNQTTSEEIYAGHENYAVYSVSQFQYIILAIVFSRGPPYRQPIYTNKLLCGSIVIMTILSVYITLWPDTFLIDLFELVMPPDDDPKATFFRYQMIMFAIVHSLLAMFIEYVLMDYVVFQKLRPLMHNVSKSKKRYIRIEHEITLDKDWPYTNCKKYHQNEKSSKGAWPNTAKKRRSGDLPPDKRSGGHPGTTTIVQYQSAL